MWLRDNASPADKFVKVCGCALACLSSCIHLLAATACDSVWWRPPDAAHSGRDAACQQWTGADTPPSLTVAHILCFLPTVVAQCRLRRGQAVRPSTRQDPAAGPGRERPAQVRAFAHPASMAHFHRSRYTAGSVDLGVPAPPSFAMQEPHTPPPAMLSVAPSAPQRILPPRPPKKVCSNVPICPVHSFCICRNRLGRPTWTNSLVSHTITTQRAARQAGISQRTSERCPRREDAFTPGSGVHNF